MERFRRDWESGRWSSVGMYAISQAGAKLASQHGVKIGRNQVSKWLRREQGE